MTKFCQWDLSGSPWVEVLGKPFKGADLIGTLFLASIVLSETQCGAEAQAAILSIFEKGHTPYHKYGRAES